MRISIALAAWNGTRFLEKQLDSLRLQTRGADEVVISDDASTDGTAAFCREYAARYGLGWKVLESKENGGYRRNFARAVAACTGDWICLCDQDDIWGADKLARVEEIALSHPGAQAVIHSFSCIDATGAPIEPPRGRGRSNHGLIPIALPPGVSMLPGPGKHPEYLVAANIAMGCCSAFSRAVCKRWLRLGTGGFPHDWELLLGAFYSGEIWYADEELIRYRLHGGNAIGLGRGDGQAPSMAGRERIIAEFDEVIAGANRIRADLGYAPLPGAYARFNAARARALAENSVPLWLSLLRYARLYRAKFSLRQRLGDLYLILRRAGGEGPEGGEGT